MPPPPNPRNLLLDEINALIAFISPLGADFSFDVLTTIINKFTSFLKMLETFITSLSFPNFNRSPYDEKLLYIRNGIFHAVPGSSFFWNEIPNQPSVLVVGEQLKYRKGFGVLGDVKARHILNNVTGIPGKAGLGLRKHSGENGLFMPYNGIARIDPRNRVSPVSYWSGTTWIPHDREVLGTLRLVNGQVVQKQLGEVGKVWQGIQLPSPPPPDNSGLVIRERETRIKAGDVGLEVYRNGAWQDWWIF